MELINDQEDEDYLQDNVYVDENNNLRFRSPSPVVQSRGRVVAEFHRPPSPTPDAAPAA